MLDFLGQRYGVLPSEIAKRPIQDLQFDLLVVGHAVSEEVKRARNGRKRG